MASSKGETGCGFPPDTEDVGEVGEFPEWLDEPDMLPLPDALLANWSACPSSHLSIDRRRAFMKKLETVASSRPKLAEMAICCSFVGRRFSCKK